ncbi:MAG: Holliday junction resolvase RuvX, partial [Pseudomonadota bacterium]
MTFDKYPRFQQFQGQNILAIDYGSKVTGFAFFCPGRDPYPLPWGKTNHAGAALVEEIQKIITQENVQVVVLGLPLYTDGKSSRQTEEVKIFAVGLQKAITPVAVHLQDETLTTDEAQ